MRSATRTLEGLPFPGTFALVMATGIVSIAASLQGLTRASAALFAVSLAAYPLVWALTIVRMVRWPRRILPDLSDHSGAFRLLAAVAATSVLGSEVLLYTGRGKVAEALWGLAVVLWLVLVYAILVLLTTRERKPPLEAGLNGSWLLSVVSTESLAVLGALVAPVSGAPRPVMLLSLATFLLGALLYVLLMALILFRWLFLPFPPEAATPPYWIATGATAITTLAGAHLLLSGPGFPLVRRLDPFLSGATLLFWATGTFWIPLLVLVFLWRHLLRAGPVRWDPQYWSVVFPLGMYAVATHALAHAASLPFLLEVARLFVWLALAAWILASAGFLRNALRRRAV